MGIEWHQGLRLVWKRHGAGVRDETGDRGGMERELGMKVKMTWRMEKGWRLLVRIGIEWGWDGVGDGKERRW